MPIIAPGDEPICDRDHGAFVMDGVALSPTVEKRSLESASVNPFL